MKILMTGNSEENIAQGMKNVFPDTTFISRSNGYDLTTREGIEKAVELSKDYDIFINSSLLSNFGQTILLQHVWTEWRSIEKTGHIISIGSSADYFQRADNKLYPIEKRSLHDLNRSLSMHCTWHDSKIRCTYFAMGGVNTPKTKKQWPHITVHDIPEIVNMIKWIIETPENINLDEIHITPIQPLEKSQVKSAGITPQFASGDGRIFTKR